MRGKGWRWKDAGKLGGGTSTQGVGLHESSPGVQGWLSSMRKGRKEGSCSAQSPLRALHDFRTRFQNPARCTRLCVRPLPGPASCLLTSMFSCPGKSASWDVSSHAILSFLTRMFFPVLFPSANFYSSLTNPIQSLLLGITFPGFFL